MKPCAWNMPYTSLALPRGNTLLLYVDSAVVLIFYGANTLGVFFQCNKHFDFTHSQEL
jgi:hypothetical protein